MPQACIDRRASKVLERVCKADEQARPACVGWVLLIPDESEKARVLAAILISGAFISLHLALKPLKRCASPHWRVLRHSLLSCICWACAESRACNSLSTCDHLSCIGIGPRTAC